MIRLTTFTCLAACLVFRAVPCVAQEPDSETARVVVLTMEQCCPDTAWPAAETAVSDELGTIDLHVEQIPGEPIPQVDRKLTLSRVARQNNAGVVLHLSSTSDGEYRADILTIRPGGQERLQHLYFNGETAQDSLHTATLRIVETVRAGLFYIPPALPAPEPVPEVSFYKAGVGVAVSGAWSPGGTDPSLGIGAYIHIKPASFLIVEMDFHWALYTRDITREGAKATFDMQVLRGSLYWDMVPGGRVHPALGLGAGALFSRSAGRSEPSEGNFEQKERVAYLGAVGRLALDMTSHSSFVLNFRGGFLVPELKIYLKDELAADYGRPLLELFAGFEFHFL